VVEIHESVCGPELFLKLLASHDVAVVQKQHRQDLERLFLEPEAQAMLAQFACLKIQLENSKTEQPARLMVVLHEDAKLSGEESVPLDRVL
jgi:hypothetical protein